MENKRFAHLHHHSTYSQLDGLGSPKQLAEFAKAQGYHYAAITDHGNIDAAIKLQAECDKVGIKPVIGCELYVVPDHRKREKEKSYHCLVLVKNLEGWANLLYMLTQAHLTGFYYRPRISPDLLLERHEGLVISTACTSSFLNMPGGERLLLQLYNAKGYRDVYLEVMPHVSKEQAVHNLMALDLHVETGIPLLATNDNHYLTPDQNVAQQIMLAINRKQVWSDPNRYKFGDEYECHMRSADEMVAAFEEQGVLDRGTVLKAMRETVAVAERCSGWRIPKRTFNLPRVPGLPENEEDFLWELCSKGFRDKFGVDINEA